jgi:hypothetical protein
MTPTRYWSTSRSRSTWGVGSDARTSSTTASSNAGGTGWPVAASRRAESAASCQNGPSTRSRMAGKSAS